MQTLYLLEKFLKKKIPLFIKWPCISEKLVEFHNLITFVFLIQILTACVDTTKNSMFNVFFTGIEIWFTGKDKLFKHYT